MSKLYSANMSRIFKSGIFLLCIAAMLIFTLFQIKNGIDYLESERKPISLEDCYFNDGPFFTLFFSVFIPMFMGKEYSFGTIRSKLTVGHTRGTVYLAYFLSCLTGVGILLAVWFLAGLTGIPKLGLWQADAVTIISQFLITILYSAALTAIFTFFSMMITSRSVSAVFQIFMALGMIVLASMCYNTLCEPEFSREVVFINNAMTLAEPKPNPYYISGIQRTIYIDLVNILPPGQGILMLHDETANDVPNMPILQMVSSIAATFIFTIAGMFIFKKKDIK